MWVCSLQTNHGYLTIKHWLDKGVGFLGVLKFCKAEGMFYMRRREKHPKWEQNRGLGNKQKCLGTHNFYAKEKGGCLKCPWILGFPLMYERPLRLSFSYTSQMPVVENFSSLCLNHFDKSVS